MSDFNQRLNRLVRKTGDDGKGFVAYRDWQYAALGLCGEAGEVAGEVKKISRNDNGYLTPERRVKIISEIGDVLWYAEALAMSIGVSLKDCLAAVEMKLNERYENGTIKERE